MTPFRTVERERGFSLIELVIASSLLGMMVFAVSTLAVRGADATEYCRRLTRVTEITQDLIDNMRIELVSSVRIFGNNAEGTANRAVLDLTGAPPPLASWRLPTVSTGGTLQRDTVGNEITGNCLFFAKLAWSDRFTCTSGNNYLIDVCRWSYHYLSPANGGPVAGSPVGLDLTHVVSEPLADGAGIDNITDPTDQAEVLVHLYFGTPDDLGVSHAPCQVVWIRGGDPTVDGTLREIDPADGSLSTDPLVSSGRPNPWRVLRSQATVQGRLAYRHHSIATNFSPVNQGVSRFGILSASGAGFPHGFETQVTGPSAARQLLLHFVVASNFESGHTAYANMQVVVDARDL